MPAKPYSPVDALNYVADMTYCGNDAEWHMKPGYDPQIVLDAITRADEEKTQLTVGPLINWLPSFKSTDHVRCENPKGWIIGVCSYRGYYEQLALNYSDDAPPERRLTCAALREALANLLGQTITGYKGGEYRVTLNTPVWVSQPGETSGRQVVGMREGAEEVGIQTRKEY